MSETMSPMSQFEIVRYLKLSIFGVDFSITNSSITMLLCAIGLPMMMRFLIIGSDFYSKKFQFIFTLLNFNKSIAIDNIGQYGKTYVNLVSSLLLYIGGVNLLGMFLFSPTSHFSVTITLGIVVFMIYLIAGISFHRKRFLSSFIPSGVPAIMAPLMFFLELFTYLFKPFSLGLRLFANIMAGHIMIAVVGGFIYMMGYLGFIPFLFIVALAIFESAIGVFQAYIFTLLSSVYIAGSYSSDH